MFDWDDMRVFLALARERKLAPAARLLGIDPTTLGRRVGRLEQALGTLLFEPGAGERVLTAKGNELLVHAERLESAALAAQEASGGAQGLVGQVRLSVSEGFGTWVLAPGLARFNQQHPGVRLDLVSASGFLNPSKREADMALMLARPQKGRLSVQRLGDYDLHLYAGPGYLGRCADLTSPADLPGHTLVGYVPDFLFSPELDYLGEVHAGLEANLRATSINMQYRMILDGAGIGVLPDFIGRTDPRLTPLLTGRVRITRSFWLVVHEDLRHLPRIEAVARWLQESALTLKSPALRIVEPAS